jgi:hypothetical protein
LNECRDKAAGKTFTEKEKKNDYNRTKHFKGKKGGKSKVNVAKDEAPDSEDDNFTLAIQVKILPRPLSFSCGLIDSYSP